MTTRIRCAVVGGGPAGMMAGYLLARAGIEVAVFEKHGDFLRDFRGDTIHPSTLDLLGELGLLDAFLALPHQKTERLSVELGGERYGVADFRHLGLACNYIAFVPQWDFLDFLADHGRTLAGFHLEMDTRATDLVIEDGRVVGVAVEGPHGAREVRADLVIAADGRRSAMRAQSGLPQRDLGAPIDVLWFRLPRRPEDPPESMGAIGGGGFMAMIARDTYWQCGYVIPKGSADTLRAEGMTALRARIAAVSPRMADRVDSLADFDDVSLLSVSVDRLERWSRPGLLCIGDAAHAMSPVGGIGINLAIQDAVAAANALAPALRRQPGPPSPEVLQQVEQRRMWPTRMTQRLQVAIQDRVVRPLISGGGPAGVPLPLRILNRFPLLQRIPARLIGLGFRRERISPGLFDRTP